MAYGKFPERDLPALLVQQTAVDHVRSSRKKKFGTLTEGINGT